MILAADDLDAMVETHQQATVRRLIVISDLQQGSNIEPLQAYQWPQSVHVQFRTVRDQAPGNASLAILGSADETDDERGVRMRVNNSADAATQQFQIGWAGAQDDPLGPRVAVSVPPGESRVVHVPHLPPQSDPPICS